MTLTVLAPLFISLPEEKGGSHPHSSHPTTALLFHLKSFYASTQGNASSLTPDARTPGKNAEREKRRTRH